MALAVEIIKKTLSIEINGKPEEVEYPNQDMTIEEAVKHLSGLYPQLNNAKIEGPEIKNNKAHYKASTKTGRLG